MNAIDYLNQAQLAYKTNEYGKALAFISDAESEGKACPELLILKGACIQLASETDFPVDHALGIYDAVIAKQPRNAHALMEKAFFLLNVKDDAVQAQAHFDKAAKFFGEFLEEAFKGLVKSKMETGTSLEKGMAEIEKFVQEIPLRVRTSINAS